MNLIGVLGRPQEYFTSITEVSILSAIMVREKSGKVRGKLKTIRNFQRRTKMNE